MGPGCAGNTKAMIGKLMTLPLRVSLKTTSLALRGTLELTQTTFSVGEQLISLLRHDDGGAAPSPHPEAPHRETPDREASRQQAGSPRAARESAVAPEPPSSDVPRRDPRRSATTNGSEPPVAEPRPARTEPPAELRQNVIDLDAPPEPLDGDSDPVSEEATLVEERADPGAENGAGAQIHVAEPFQGYDALNAQAVIARVSAADEAQLTAIRLYESTHRKRGTVLRAVDRRFAQIQNEQH